jgi:hypothetical protein
LGSNCAVNVSQFCRVFCSVKFRKRFKHVSQVTSVGSCVCNQCHKKSRTVNEF